MITIHKYPASMEVTDGDNHHFGATRETLYSSGCTYVKLTTDDAIWLAECLEAAIAKALGKESRGTTVTVNKAAVPPGTKDLVLRWKDKP